MDELKITISGIEEVTVKGISIGDVKKRKVNSKFNYDENNNYVGQITHAITAGTNYDLFIEITGQENIKKEECSCNIKNDTSGIDYGTLKGQLTYDNEDSEFGGVNFIFDIY